MQIVYPIIWVAGNAHGVRLCLLLSYSTVVPVLGNTATHWHVAEVTLCLLTAASHVCLIKCIIFCIINNQEAPPEESLTFSQQRKK